MTGLVGIADEYGTIWRGEPGASERIGDLVQRADQETFEVRLTSESELRKALRDILLIESGRSIRYTRRLTDEQMWQAMTDIARAALEATR
jgi:hypothetical protein